jgi:hypothetical protein
MHENLSTHSTSQRFHGTSVVDLRGDPEHYILPVQVLVVVLRPNNVLIRTVINSEITKFPGMGDNFHCF